MVLTLTTKIKQNKKYINTGNILSHFLLLYGTGNIDALSIVLEKEKQAEKYKKIGRHFGLDFFIVNNFVDFVNIIYNKKKKYLIYKNIFFLNIDKQFFVKNSFRIHEGQTISPEDLAKKCNKLDIPFDEYLSPLSFSIQGDVFQYIDSQGKKVQMSFWGDEVESILSDGLKQKEYVFGKNLSLQHIDIQQKENDFLLSLFQELDTHLVLDTIDFYSFSNMLEQRKADTTVFSAFGADGEAENLHFSDLLIKNTDELKELLIGFGGKKIICTKHKKTLQNFLELNTIDGVLIEEVNSPIGKSFRSRKEVLIADDNLSNIFIKKRVKRSFGENLDFLLHIKKGDFVVHIDHGIGVYVERIFKEIPAKKGKIIKQEYLQIDYKGNDKLFIPITEISRLSKYVGAEHPKLTSLSTNQWEKKLQKVSEDVEQIASELLEIYAKRKLQKGKKSIINRQEEKKFHTSFDYIYTDDQIHSIEEIYSDMESELPMDRLLIGDVGYGKTEVAFAAIFKAVLSGRQAALISPLVVLAYEHFEKAVNRFENYPFNIAVITRFESKKSVEQTLKKLSEGKIDIIIGTHRLLSEDVGFKDLGLLVIDEEHKFGVRDKEKIKTFKGNIDILSLSATPIPRSLNMALSGIRQVSMLQTPPNGKQAIETIVAETSDSVIYPACQREFSRGGQVFFIYNRVQTIESFRAYLEKLFPEKKVIVAHGQLPGDQLEKRIIAFKQKKYDILLSTTVIENGIDFSGVNTIFIHDSVNFGMSQIHQLRGRVGRGVKKGYCYLLFKKDKIKEDAAKRLKTIVEYSHLGAGFELAVKDLEMRGGGDILGIKQSGSSTEVGLTLFIDMLEDKIASLQSGELGEGEKEEKKQEVRIDLLVEAYIPDEFFTTDLDKLQFYREIESIRSIEHLDEVYSGFQEINPVIPKETKTFFDLLRVKILASGFGICSIKKVGINYQLDFVEKTKEKNLEMLRKFLDMDTELHFFVVNAQRIRTSEKKFASQEKFVSYLLQIFEKKFVKKYKGSSKKFTFRKKASS